jgi:hypothetical protein
MHPLLPAADKMELLKYCTLDRTCRKRLVMVDGAYGLTSYSSSCWKPSEWSSRNYQVSVGLELTDGQTQRRKPSEWSQRKYQVSVGLELTEGQAQRHLHQNETFFLSQFCSDLETKHRLNSI